MVSREETWQLNSSWKGEIPMACNCCNNMYQSLILKGKQETIPVPQLFENCPSCGARPRFKTFRIVYETHVLSRIGKAREQLSALLVSPTKRWEQDIIQKDVGTVIVSAMYGQYSENTIRSDLRNLNEFENAQFDYVHACNVLDYIHEVDLVLQSVSRVLKPGGLFLFHIAEERLVNNDHPPYIRGSKREPYYPEGLALPSVTFGKKDLLKRMKASGFQAEKCGIKDLFSGQRCTWFLGTKSP